MARVVFGSVALAVIAALAGCATTIADDALSVCQPLCRCEGPPLPGAQRDCVTGCVAQFEMHPLGEACVTCIVGHATACGQLDLDCRDICAQATPLLPAPATTSSPGPT